MSAFSRRRFLRLALGGLAASALGGCGDATARPTSTPIPLATRAHAPTPDRPLLRSENAPGFYVRYFKPFEAVDPNRWTLSVEGLIRHPQTLSLSNVLALPRTVQVSRLKCVECWSAAAHWEGFHLSALIELAQPQADARWLHLHCADGYYESAPIETLLAERVLFVHHMNGQILPDLHGAPLRLLIPELYGYKSAKAIVRLEFAQTELRGYWSAVGGYSPAGAIRRGFDHPLDLEGSRRIEGGGEIIYPDGIESGNP